jgi:hypothetical protein
LSTRTSPTPFTPQKTVPQATHEVVLDGFTSPLAVVVPRATETHRPANIINTTIRLIMITLTNSQKRSNPRHPPDPRQQPAKPLDKLVLANLNNEQYTTKQAYRKAKT